MSAADDFLVEIGTEELPPKALQGLMRAFADNLEAAVDEARLAHGPVHAYASPRRLSVMIEALASGQEDRKTTQKGPPISVAFDKDGNMTAAASAFAKKCGVAPGDLGRTSTEKGEWLSCDVVEAGRPASELLPELIERALGALPIPRRMRWGAGDVDFVRPAHWIVLLHGEHVLDTAIMGIAAGNQSRGHRFHSAGPIAIARPREYLETLRQDGRVIADFARRLELVREGVASEARAAGGTPVADDGLYEEVTALVEWPVPLTGSFDEKYLQLPREVVVSTLTSHQRYFPIEDAEGRLLPRFVTVANLESNDPNQVRDGNERVIRPRLADAAFFWDSDRRTALSARSEALREVVYQRGLGSLYDKSGRIARIAADIASETGADHTLLGRIAMSAKCDLLTGMVGEFPELQGTMGKYYATADGESEAFATAIGEQYLPRFHGDDLPSTLPGQILSVADRLDTLAGIFSIGKKPSGNRDPFGLRRAALGIIRIVIECGLDIDLKAAIHSAAELQPSGKIAVDDLSEELYTFVADRLRRYFLDRDAGLATETFDAVLARRPDSLVDSLAAANKRIANILRQADAPGDAKVREKLLDEPAERALWSALRDARHAVGPMVDARDYTDALTRLADLRAPVDLFFDDVMVMTDDDATRNNRLALLGELRALFLDVADISRLSI